MNVQHVELFVNCGYDLSVERDWREAEDGELIFSYRCTSRKVTSLSVPVDFFHCCRRGHSHRCPSNFHDRR